MPNYQEHGRWFFGEKDLDGHGEGTKMQLQYFCFIVLEEVSALHFGRS